MIKILLTLFLITVSINANNLSSITMDNIMGNKEEGKTSKKYIDLINFLKKSSNGEYSMYLAVIYLNGISTPDEDGNTIKENTSESIKYFEKAINLEYYQAAAMLGSLYIYEDKFIKENKSLEKAKYYLDLSIKKEVYEATVALSSIYFYYEKNIEKGLEYLHLGAQKGISTSQLALATLYGYGSKDLNIPQNKIIGNNFLEMACLNKHKTKKVKEFCDSSQVINKTEVN